MTLDIERLRFRRQFILVSDRVSPPTSFFSEIEVGSYFLYWHRDIEKEVAVTAEGTYLLLGYWLDPDRPQLSNLDLLNECAQSKTREEVLSWVEKLTGRFVLIVQKKNEHFAINDPCGFRTLYFGESSTTRVLGSDPNIMGGAIQVEETEDFSRYCASAYVRNNKEFNLPGNTTLLKNVQKLTPNHYLDIQTYDQTRFWPTKPIEPIDYSSCLQRSIDLLQGSITAASMRNKLAFTLTSGLDSRIILSMSELKFENMLVYTNKYRKMTSGTADLRIPARISEDLNYPYEQITVTEDVKQEFREIFAANSYLSHYNDWGIIASTLATHLEGYMNVRGNSVELTRSYYFQNGLHPKLIDKGLAYKLKKWPRLKVIDENIGSWVNDVNRWCPDLGYKQLDFLYWEMHYAGWQAQSQMENDIAFETLTPFNNRELVGKILALPLKYRVGPTPKFHLDLIQNSCPALLKYPINPANSVREYFGNIKRNYGWILQFRIYQLLGLIR